MPLRVGFDLDGVLADMDTALAREVESLFGVPAESAGVRTDDSEPAGAETNLVDSVEPAREKELPLSKLMLTVRQQRQLWRQVRGIENFWEGLSEIEPGSVETLAKLAEEHQWEVIFLTQRPGTSGYTAQRQSQRWLQRHGFQCPSVFVVSGSRGKIADALALQAVVDDRPENCLDVTIESKAKAILVLRSEKTTRPANARRLGIDVVQSLTECFDILLETDRAARPRPSLLKRLLG